MAETFPFHSLLWNPALAVSEYTSAQLLLVVALVALAITAILSVVLDKRRFPPAAAARFGSIAESIANGSFHRFAQDLANELGPVYRVRSVVEFGYIYVVCDAELMRVILEGDPVRNIPPGEKIRSVNLNGVTLGVPSIISKRTKNEG
jgi:hypothetical protein